MKLDARSKLVLVCFTSLVYGFRLSWQENIGLILALSLLFFWSGQWRLGLLAVLGYAGVYALSLLDSLPSWLSHFLLVLHYVWAPLMAGHFLLLTTTSYELIHGLRSCFLPEPFLLTLGVLFRFLPMIKREVRVIHAALQVRGIFLRKRAILLHPLSYVEHLLVPLMLSLLRTAHELTIATLTKGVALSGKSSHYLTSSWTWIDWSLCLCCLSFLLWKMLPVFR